MTLALSILGAVLFILLVGAFMHWWKWPRRHRRTKISLLVPYRTDHDSRYRTWQWLKEYWKTELPEAEIILGNDYSMPFCKTAAVNNAFKHAKGNIIVILDADCYIPGDVIRDAAKDIMQAKRQGYKLWFVPYRRFYRLVESASQILLDSSPRHPWHLPDPPPPWAVEHEHSESSGHWWGALIQIMPREAFIAAGGMDERFHGWGGEDISFMHAVDTLYAHHRTTNNPVYHIWHPIKKGKWAATKQWEGQPGPEMNDWLSDQYSAARGDPLAMAELIKGK